MINSKSEFLTIIIFKNWKQGKRLLSILQLIRDIYLNKYNQVFSMI
jgi:hypothetical protein